MFTLLTKLIPSSLTNRLANRYTAHGSWLLLFVMAEQGIISKDAVKALEGVPNLHIWILVALAVYLILKAPKAFKDNKTQKLKHEIELKQLALSGKKLELEYLKVKQEELKLKEQQLQEYQLKQEQLQEQQGAQPCK